MHPPFYYSTNPTKMYFLRRAALRLVASATASSIPTRSRPAVARKLPRLGSVAAPRLTGFNAQRRWNSSEVPKPGAGSQDGVESVESKNRDVSAADEENAQVIDAAAHATAAESTRPEEVTDQEATAAEQRDAYIDDAQPQFTETDAARSNQALNGQTGAAQDGLSVENEGEGPRDIDQMPEPSPKPTVYVKSLCFDVTPADLKKRMEEFGSVRDARVVTDSRGLSKGFGYCQFDSMQSAVSAKEAMHQTIYEGRTVQVKYAKYNLSQRTSSGIPSRTIHISNMSYDLTDRDIHGLFKDLPNAIDVRVSIDRRTGLPRGFAHAEFLDAESGRVAYEYLGGRVVHGRPLRVAYCYDNRRAVTVRRFPGRR